MKKFFLIVVILLSGMAIANAQFKVQAGVNLIQGDFELGTAKLDKSQYVGFNLGVTATLPIYGPLYVNSGLLYTQKGSHFEITLLHTYKANLLIEYIEVPLNLRAQFEVGPVKLFAQGGPYVAYALANKIDYDDPDEEDYIYDFGTDDDTMDHLDFGYNVAAGVGYSAIELMVNYGQGFGNVYNSPELIPGVIKNKVLSVSVAVNF